MSAIPTDELVLAFIDERVAAEGDQPFATPSEIAAALGHSTHQVSERIELVAILEGLVEEGLVEGSSRSERAGFVLTNRGRERADRIRSELAAHEVTLDDGEETTVAEVADRVDRSPVEVAAGIQNGTYYRRELPEEQFVDRETAVERCLAPLTDLESGGTALAITGAPGVGKTELADHVFEGIEVLRSSCGGEGSGPYQPLRSALAPVLEDLHAADPGTLAYLEYLLDRIGDWPLGVAAAWRPESRPDGGPFVDGWSARVDLAAFDLEDSREFFERRTTTQPE